ncbi:MAG: squalene--hopene cyclase [Acidobacteria bacterium]|nr:squalene--hopene cyclase [Acidobacteriota bacterium]
MNRNRVILGFLLVPWAGLCLVSAYWIAQIDTAADPDSDPQVERVQSDPATPEGHGSYEPEVEYVAPDEIEVDRAPELRFGPYSRHDTFATDFSVERAAAFIDKVSLTWGTKYGCVTCHTNGYYMTAPKAIFGNRPAFQEVRRGAERFVQTWNPEDLPTPDYVVATAAFLTINDVQMGRELGATTLKALDLAWSMQNEDGYWTEWSKCNWPPYESDDHFGPSLLALAIGMAPESYARTETVLRGMARIRGYLASHPPAQIHHKAMLLWVSRYVEGIVAEVDRVAWVSELLDLQRQDGGWASGDLGQWRQLNGKPSDPPVTVESDGYGTGFVVFVLRQAGVPAADPRIRRGVTWLRTHQRSDGQWWTQSLRNEPDTDNFLTHTGTTFALKALDAADTLGTAADSAGL